MNPTAIKQSYIEQLHARIRGARATSDDLFQIVRPKALYDRPIPERHRIIFIWVIWRRSIGICSLSRSARVF